MLFLLVGVFVGGCGKNEKTDNQTQTQDKEQVSVDTEKKDQAKENLEETFENEDGELMKKRNMGKFSIIYPADWFWADHYDGIGNFVSNNRNIKDPWTGGPDDLNENDVILTISSAPLAPLSKEISADIKERLIYEVERGVDRSMEKSPSISCEEITESEFEIEYECQNNVDGVYYRTKRMGIIRTYASQYLISAKSKNPELVKKFSIEKND